MKTSNKVKRNIFLILMIIGILNCIGYILNIIMEGSSVNDWMKLFVALGFTFIALAYYHVFNKRLKRGIIFGNTNFTATY